MLDCIRSHLIGAGLRNELTCKAQRFKRAGIRPPTLQKIPRHETALNVGIVHIRDLKLAAW
jgi:hypothetical protein